MINKAFKQILFFAILFSVPIAVCGQNKSVFVTAGFGPGLIEGNPGTNLDVEFGYQSNRLGISFYFNSMTSLKDMNPHSEYILSIIEEVPDLQPFDGVNYRSSELRTQTSFGPQIEYIFVNSYHFNLSIGGGINYNIYFRKQFIEDWEQIDFLHYTYLSRTHRGISKQGFLHMDYEVNDNIRIGFKIRLTDYIDYNLGLTLGARMKFGII